MKSNKCVAFFGKFIWEECFKEQGNIFVLVLISVNRHYANMNHTEITNTMQPCTRIYYSNVYQMLNMLRATHRSSSGVQKLQLQPLVLHTSVGVGRCQGWVWIQFPLSLDSGRHPQTCVKPEAAITVFELLMMSGVSCRVGVGRCQGWVWTQFPLSLDSGLHPQTCVKPEAAITVFELLMMSGVSLETCWAIDKHWNNKFYYMIAPYWLFLYDLYYDTQIHELQVC
jgi:hypothetical protein